MDSKELREKFIEFFKNRGHQSFPASGLVPENDPSVLFTTAGMQQFKEFYLHPEAAPAKNMVTCQPCLRTSDIEKVGDDTHLTFFEMLGNFSFGGYFEGSEKQGSRAQARGSYFKKEAIGYAWEFLTKNLGVDPSRISGIIFPGDKKVPRDDESASILESMAIKYTENQDGTFWGPTGDEGPCGRSVEIYFDDVEIWTLVFNEFYKTKDQKLNPLKTKGVDTGLGLERMLVVLNNFHDIYETDLFQPIIHKVEEETSLKMDKDSEYIKMIADHLRSSVMIAREGIVPGKNERESVLRTLIRRSVQYSSMAGDSHWIEPIVETIINIFQIQFPDLQGKKENIIQTIFEEGQNFQKVLSKCEKILKERKTFSAQDAFFLYQTEGCPLRLYKDYAAQAKILIKDEDFQQEKAKHQEISRAGVGMFKGGLASGGEKETKYHTATHLLLKALQIVLGAEVHQRGSNINAERLRFDFSYPDKLTDEQIRQVEEIVNQKISENLPVTMAKMTVEEAKEKGAEAQFTAKYGDKVKVYSIGDFSCEICGGPHVERTGILGHFKIIKEESSSAGIRRIKAVLK